MQPPVPPISQAPEIPFHTPEKSIKTALASIWLYLSSQVGVSLIVGLVFGGVAGLLFGGHPTVTGVELLDNVSMLLTSIVSALLVCLYAIPKLRINLKKELKESRYKKSDLFYGVCLCYGFSLPLGMLTGFLSYLLMEWFGVGIPEMGNSTSVTFGGELIYILLVVIAAPLCEEIVFRGIIMNSLKKFSPAFAIVFSALLFALAHLNLYQGISVMGMGLAMGFMYMKTGSLQASIFMHFINNSIAVLADYVPFQYTWMLSIVLLVMMIIGWVYLFKNKETINRIATQEDQKPLWAYTGKQAGFWLLVGFFVVMSIASIIVGV